VTDSRSFESLIRDVRDFPKPGIVFKDLTTLFMDADAFARAMRELEQLIDWTGVELIVAIEARGFILGGYLAATRGLGFVPIRKPGKLPSDCVREEYTLEYGSDAIEMHRDACAGGRRVVIVDDVLATGGTAAAAARLVEASDGVVGDVAFLLELDFLDGRSKLPGRTIKSLIHVGGE